MTEAATRDHGGGLDAAMAAYGGARGDWLDLSTGINPEPYPPGTLPDHAWSALPDAAAMARLLAAARRFWRVPDGAEVVAAPGASALIAKLPLLTDAAGAYIPGPTYNEHQAAFAAHGNVTSADDAGLPTHVYVHPNNPDGRLWPGHAIGGRAGLTIVDESFCDVAPENSHIAQSTQPGVIILKSFGKFWGLAGLRLGFAIASPATLKGPTASLPDLLGPWAISGPALHIAARALEDDAWAQSTRARLTQNAARLDALLTAQGARVKGGTTLFRLYEVADAKAAQHALAQRHILTRIFPYSKTWIRLGLPPQQGWPQLEAALGTAGGAIRADAVSRGSAEPTTQ